MFEGFIPSRISCSYILKLKNNSKEYILDIDKTKYVIPYIDIFIALIPFRIGECLLKIMISIFCFLIKGTKICFLHFNSNNNWQL